MSVIRFSKVYVCMSGYEILQRAAPFILRKHSAMEDEYEALVVANPATLSEACKDCEMGVSKYVGGFDNS